LDYLDYNSSSKVLTITKTPYDFYDVYNSKNDDYEGVSNLKQMKLKKETTDEEFEENIKRILNVNNITFSLKESDVVNYKCLPDTLDEFIHLFLDETFSEKAVKNSEMLKKRIMGLTSYFKSAQEELLPRYEKKEDFHILNIPMSDYQFILYEKERQKERKQEKFRSQKKVVDLYTESSSTYRIFSRLFCNFVMPEGYPRPFPKKTMEEIVPPEEMKKELKELENEKPLELKEKKKREKCPNGTKRNKEGDCVDKEGKIVGKKIKEVILLEPPEEPVMELKEKKKREKCPKGTKKNKEGECVDKDGNIVKKKEEVEKI